MKVYSQAGVRISIGEKPIVSLGARGKFNVLECDSCTITRVCRPSMPETRGLQVDSMQFNGDLLSAILGGSAPEAKRDRLAQDDRDGCPGCLRQTLDRERWTPQQKALTLEIANIREWQVNSDAQIRWTADENMIMNGLTKDQQESRRHLARVLSNGEWSVQRDATLVREESASQSNVNEGRKRLQRVPVTSPISWRLNFFVETESELLVEQIVDVPLPQIMEEIVEVVQIVDVPVPQIELVFLLS